MPNPRVMLAAGASGSGKTLITCGILQALRKQNRKVAAFKCGPDYIDPLFHEKVLQTKSRNLDLFFTDEETTRYLFARAAEGREVSVIEGVMGYYDGLAGTCKKASAYDLAGVTETPVILIVNAKGMSLSLLAYIKGFLTYEKESHIKGVILNQISKGMYQKIAPRIEQELGITVYGYVPQMPELSLKSRHLGLILPNEIAGLEEKLAAFAAVLEKTLHLEEILKLAASAPEIPVAEPNLLRQVKAKAEAFSGGKPVIAVARDEAFCFIYEDNLKLLEESGAVLRYFSPLHEREVPPEASGILLYGGYPELYAKKLEQNKAMRTSILTAMERGIPCMAECGGFMYLHETIEDRAGNRYQMVGAVKGTAYQTETLGRFGYITLEPTAKEVFGSACGLLKGHEFHYFDSTSCGTGYLARKPLGKRNWYCLHAEQNSLLGFPHLYYYASPLLAEAFVEKCRVFSAARGL